MTPELELGLRKEYVRSPTRPVVWDIGNNPSSAMHSLQGVLTIPEIIWELFLGIYCTWKGFRPESPILRADARRDLATATPAGAPA